MLFMFTYPGAPCIYYGDEVGMRGAHDPDCRRGFPWDDSHWNYDLLNYTKAVIALRKEHEILRRGSFHRLYSQDQVLAFGRKLDGWAVVVALNTGQDKQKVAIPLNLLDANIQKPVAIFGPESHPHIENNEIRLNLPPRSGTVIKLGA
jgi:neopullulanase